MKCTSALISYSLTLESFIQPGHISLSFFLAAITLLMTRPVHKSDVNNLCLLLATCPYYPSIDVWVLGWQIRKCFFTYTYLPWGWAHWLMTPKYTYPHFLARILVPKLELIYTQRSGMFRWNSQLCASSLSLSRTCPWESPTSRNSSPEGMEGPLPGRRLMISVFLLRPPQNAFLRLKHGFNLAWSAHCIIRVTHWW